VQEAGSEQGSGSSIPNNQIWYTSTNGAVVKPYATDVFGANIVSNTYENGQGVIKFDAPVTLIGEAAFCYCETLKSITIPDSVTEIGKEAFTVCTSLTMFYGKFASKDGRCLIVDGVLNSFAIGCGVTEYVIPDSVTSIGYCAFYGCTSLKSVTIPDGVIEIGEGAFVGLISLTSVTIPKSVTKIGWQAFQDCTSITRVNISDLSAWCKIDFAMNIPIGDRLGDSNPLSIAIDGNTQLFLNGEEVVDLIIPYDVTQINVDTFMGCSSINTVVLHSGVKVVNTGAFSWCANLSRVYCWAIHPPIGGGDMFFKTDSDLTIYVPTASVNEYKISAYWDIYKNCIVGYDFPL